MHLFREAFGTDRNKTELASRSRAEFRVVSSLTAFCPITMLCVSGKRGTPKTRAESVTNQALARFASDKECRSALGHFERTPLPRAAYFL
jgi:hypothetical protein